MVTNTSNFLTALMEAYAYLEHLRLEIRPLWPSWMESDLYPDGRAPHYWRSEHQYRTWFALTAPGISAAANYATELSDRFDVYFSVLPRNGCTGKAEDVCLSSWLWADIDGGNEGVQGSIALVKKCDIPPPHIAVVSGGGLHCYWRFDPMLDIADQAARNLLKNVLKRLCKAIGGDMDGAHADTAPANLACVLRVPGTYNHKQKSEPRAVRLIRFKPEMEAHSLTWWRAYLPALQLPARRYPVSKLTLSGNSRGNRSEDGLLRWASNGYAEGERHKRLASDAKWLVRDLHLDKQFARELIEIKADASPGTKPVTRSEIEAIIKWA